MPPPSPWLDRLESGLRSGLGAAASLLLAAIAVICFVEVILRYVFGASLVWYDEFVGYLLVWLTFVGAVLAQSHRQHIGIENALERLPERFRKLVEVANHALLAAIHVVLLVYGSRLALRFLSERAITLPVPMGVVYTVIPLTAALMIVVEGISVLRLLTEGRAERAE
jgi:TRAP-type C4-dicarboxylate transport system permease small subunit